MRPDPGENFATDEHRRLMAALANPDEEPLNFGDICRRVDRDDHLDLDDTDEIKELLADLEAEGDAEKVDGRWRNTETGFAVLTGDNADNGGRRHAAYDD